MITKLEILKLKDLKLYILAIIVILNTLLKIKCSTNKVNCNKRLVIIVTTNL